VTVFRRARAALGALAISVGAFATVLAGGASASTPAPIGVLTSGAPHVSGAAKALRSPRLPAGAFINRPTIPLAQYNAIKSQSSSATSRSGAARAPAGPLTVSSATGFNAINQSAAGGTFPSDSNGAVGGSQIAEIVNQALATYSKTGTQTSNRTLATISGYTTEGLFDPRIIYDPNWKRFVISIDAFPESPTVQFEFILVSKASSAAGNYFVYALNLASQCGAAATNPFWDYPQVGQTQDAVTVTGNCFQGNTYVGARVFSMPKALIYNNKGFTVPVFGVATGDGTVTPANVLDSNPTMALITRGQHIVRLQDPQGAFFGSMGADTAISGFEPLAVPRSAGQAGCSTTSCHLDTSDGRFVNDSTQFGDELWNVATYGFSGVAGSFATPYWGQFSIAGSSTTQRGTAIADSCSDDFNASLVATTANKMWLNWTSTDPQGSTCGQTFVRQYEGGRLSTTASGSLSNIINPFTSPAELTGNFDPNFGLQRWGDTSSMSIDTSTVAWSINNSVVNASTWGTRIQKVTQP
jgi:hypothetical protein